MDIFGILTLIGGLALFLYGMDVMGAGLEKVSGGKLERILEKLTSNPLKGVLLGAGVTAVIQSSSATTVMPRETRKACFSLLAVKHLQMTMEKEEIFRYISVR